MANVFLFQRTDGEMALEWTRHRALKMSDGGRVIELQLPKLWTIVKDYYDERNLLVPNDVEALAWLTSELGELADAVMRNSAKAWIRNNPDEIKSVMLEGGDVLMMLVVTMILSNGSDPLDGMFRKMALKGFDLNEVCDVDL